MRTSTYISFFVIDVLGFNVLDAGEYAIAMVFGMIITSVASVDIAFIFAAMLIVLLVPIGMKYRAAKP